MILFRHFLQLYLYIYIKMIIGYWKSERAPNYKNMQPVHGWIAHDNDLRLSWFRGEVEGMVSRLSPRVTGEY